MHTGPRRDYGLSVSRAREDSPRLRVEECEQKGRRRRPVEAAGAIATFGNEATC